MPVAVHTPWGQESYTTATDWVIDRDHDLSVVDEVTDGSTIELATYASGQWLRVTRDVPASTPPA